MNDQYNTFNDPTGGSDMTDTWIFFGDPTIPLYNKNEGSITCTHTTQIGRNATWYSVNCPVNGATIGLYYQGKYLASATVVNGVAAFTFPALLNLDTVFITATKQNYTPYMGYATVVDFPVSVNEFTSQQMIAIYPNPATAFTSIHVQNGNPINQINVYTMSGALLKSIKNINSASYTLDTKKFAKGNYMLGIQIGEKIINQKITKE